VSNAFQLASPWIFKLAVDDLKRGVNQSALAVFAGLLILMAVAGGIARYIMRRRMIGVSREIEYELRRDFFRHLTNLSFSYYNRTSTGDLMARATNDLNAVRMVVGPGIMYSANTVITLAAALTLMLILSWPLTCIALLPMPLISIFMYRYGRIIHRRFENVQARFSDLNTRAQEVLSGIRVVKSYVQEPAVSREFETDNHAYLEANMSLVRVNGLFHPTIGFLAGLGTMLVLGFGGWLVIQDRITLGTFVAFNAYLTMLIWPMIALGWVVAIFQRGAASMKRINEVMGEEPEIVAPPAPAAAPPGPGRLVFEDVHFAYATRPDIPVLSGIDLAVEPGETVAVVGRTGSGKTTLINLIPRVFDPTRGRVLLDGRDLREIPIADLRRAVGCVPQETFLFSRTVSGNIALGRPGAEEEEIRRVAELAHLAGDVEEFPDRYETMVGERGVTLSGGQKQRTAIARALLRDPTILVLDDALSSVDTRTEEAILTGLRGFMRDRTTVLVAHRVSTIQLADRIVVLDGGRIVEEGNHRELLAEGGIYAEIVRMQQLEEELETAL